MHIHIHNHIRLSENLPLSTIYKSNKEKNIMYPTILSGNKPTQSLAKSFNHSIYLNGCTKYQILFPIFNISKRSRIVLMNRELIIYFKLKLNHYVRVSKIYRRFGSNLPELTHRRFIRSMRHISSDEKI